MKVLSSQETETWRLVQSIRELAQGRSVAAGSVTLTQNVATTTVTNEIIPAGCFPQLTARTAAAAAEVASVYVSAVANGSFTIAHPSNATAGRTWHWFAVGG